MLRFLQNYLKQPSRSICNSKFHCFLFMKKNYARASCNFNTILENTNQYVTADFKSKFKFHSETSNRNSNRVLFAMTVAGLLKFLGLSEEEESELMQVLKRGELSYRVNIEHAFSELILEWINFYNIVLL